MKHLLLTLAMLAVCLQTVEAQDEITIHVDGQPLAELITAEQQKSLQTLNITGELTEDDYAFLRNKKLPKLQELNLKEADIDTIPAKAFYSVGFHNDSRIILPKTCIYIGDSAFYKCISGLKLTGRFPRRGIDVFNPYRNRIWLAADNESCVEHNDDNYSIYILSADKKILYHANTSGRDIIPERVEIIAERAFENSFYDDLYFPHTLKKIEDYAFRNSRMALHDWNFIFLSTEVPTLGKEVFSFLPYSGEPSLTIPQEWENIYTEQDEQWNIFKKVTFAYNPPPTESMSSLEFKLCTILITGSVLTCTAPDAMKLEVYTPDAVKVGETLFANGTATVKVSKAPAIYLYIVTYRDGRRESGKVVMSK